MPPVLLLIRSDDAIELMRNIKKLLFELSASDFERLCLRILEKQGFQMLRSVEATIDVGYDLQGRYQEENKNKEVAIIIKHKLNLTVHEIEKILQQLFKIMTFNDLYILMTSAPITKLHLAVFDNLPDKVPNIQIIGQHELLKILSEFPELAEDFFGPITKQIRKKWFELIFSMTSVLIALIGVFFSVFQQIHVEQKPLDERIAKVESAIQNIKDLEEYLVDIKDDMVRTEREVTLINEQYAKAQELKALTENQMDTIKKALSTQGWKDIAFNLTMGFLLGIGSSFVASILYGKWRHRRSLQ